MTAKNKIKGNTFERNFVEKCKRHGLDAKRAWGSNGLSLGEAQEVDCLVEGFKVQCKKGHNHPTVKLNEFMKNVDFCAWSPADNRKGSGDFVFMHMDMFLMLVSLYSRFK
ncbi:hypothetical protein UFOVP1_40 [uncultured Caudovirales phage]|uniref:Holliday junction resolvase n=1 Tax=uncultured Caudovirales phage TaxID=2100421 RepID=A0A6J5KHE9_9CAUD|nr:hypothetical protein UFOVP1_40 [uncultured Caudovirales phage]